MVDGLLNANSLSAAAVVVKGTRKGGRKGGEFGMGMGMGMGIDNSLILVYSCRP